MIKISYSKLHNIFKTAIYITMCILVVFMCVTPVSAQGWEQEFTALEEGWAAVQTVDGGFVITGREGDVDANSDDDIFLLRVDADGKEIWKNTYGGNDLDQALDLIEANDGSYIIVGNTNSLAASSQIYVANVDSTGTLLWQKHFGSLTESDRSRAVIQASDGNFLVTGCVDCFGDSKLFILKIDPTGEEIWLKTFDQADEGFSIIETSTGELALTGEIVSTNIIDTDIYFLKTDADANTVILNGVYGQLGDDRGESILETDDGNFIVAATTRDIPGIDPDIWLLKINNNDGGIFAGWPKEYGGNGADFVHSVIETPEGDLVFGGGTWEGLDGNTYMVRTDSNGIEIWSKSYGSTNQETAKDLFQLPDGGFLLTGNSKVVDMGNVAISSGIYLIRTDALGNTFNNHIQGKLSIDENNNCSIEESEAGLEDWLIKVSGTETFYGTTDAEGFFDIPISDGSYEIEVVLPNGYWTSCQIIPTTTVNAYDTINLDFPIQKTIDCEDLQVDISAPFIQRCALNDYEVKYCNIGTKATDNAYVEVQLDENFIFNSSTVSFTNLGGNLFRFDVGAVDIGECGNFEIKVFINCFSTLLGQTHCMEAQIFPDDICLPDNPGWDGASIQVDGQCFGNSIDFTITNVGTTPSSEPLGYIIIEDQIVLREGKRTLNSDQSTTITIDNPQGKTYRIETIQSAGHPGKSMPSKTIETCGGTGAEDTSLGYVTQYPEDDADVFRSIDCQESIEDYEPNRKRAFPKGYIDNVNYVKQNTDIEYHIRFQNNFTDTVSRVIILDTLSTLLDPATVKAGVSSHDYDFEVYRNGIVKFEFDNIQLLDSLNNEDESIGYIKFRVSQKSDVSPGTLIKNTAGIYYNFNAPLSSNAHCHTVAVHAVYGSGEAEICEGFSYNGVEYPNDTIINDTISMITFDSVIVVNLDVLENQDTTVNATICNGEFYNIGETLFSVSGSYMEIIEANNTCDSTINLNLTVLTSFHTIIDTTMAPGTVYQGVVLEEDTTFIENFQAANGCDSTITTNIEVRIVDVNDLTKKVKNIKLFPNPSLGSLHINYELTEASSIQISLLNALGKEVKMIQNLEYQSTGNYRLPIEIQDVPHGLYFIQIETNEAKVLKKLIKGS